MSPRHALLLTLSVTALSACQGDRAVESFRIPNVVGATPADNSTGRSPLLVGLTNDPAYNDELEALVRSSSLVTWPELVPVPAHVEFTTPPDAGMNPFASTRYLVADDVPPDGWYALLLGDRAPEATLADGAFHRLPDGRQVARVRVGSAPDLWGYAGCPKKDGTAIIVRYTEPLHAKTTTAPLFIKAGPPGKEKDCHDVKAPVVERFETDYEFMCEPLAADDQVIVDARPGLATSSGVELPEGQRTLALDKVRPRAEIASACSSFKLDP
jgi:hypothetical protein